MARKKKIYADDASRSGKKTHGKMSRKKKIILGVMIGLTAIVGAVCVYAVNFVNKAQDTTNKMYESVERAPKESGVDPDKPVNFDATEPFSLLLLGVDSGGLGRTDHGRSDTMMVVTVNPKQKKTTITSLDRDIYTSIVGHDTVDKLNHAYAFGGVGMSMDSVESLLNIPINHYITINLDGFSELVDAVGGIDVDNKYHFELDGVELYPGKQHLNGKQALSYSRFRHWNAATKMGDPEGDIGRQRRQREVVELIVNKILSFNSITSYQKILDAVGNNTKTDLKWDDMLKIIEGYTGAAKSVEQLQLQGDAVMMDSIYYQLLHKDELLTLQNKLRAQLDLPAATELDMSKYVEKQFYGSNQAADTEDDTTTDNAVDTTVPEQNYTDEQTDTDNGTWTDNGGNGDTDTGTVTTPSSSAPTTPSSSEPETPAETTPSSTPPSSSAEPETPTSSSVATPPATATKQSE